MHFGAWRSDSYTGNPSFSVKNPSFEYKNAKQRNNVKRNNVKMISLLNSEYQNWLFPIISFL